MCAGPVGFFFIFGQDKKEKHVARGNGKETHDQQMKTKRNAKAKHENWSTFLAISEVLFALKSLYVSLSLCLYLWFGVCVCHHVRVPLYLWLGMVYAIQTVLMMCTRALSMHNMRLISDIYPSNAVDLQEIIWLTNAFFSRHSHFSWFSLYLCRKMVSAISHNFCCLFFRPLN